MKLARIIGRASRESISFWGACLNSLRVSNQARQENGAITLGQALAVLAQRLHLCQLTQREDGKIQTRSKDCMEVWK